MSQKITPKNLSYDSSLPPFLARLRGQADTFGADGPDPMLAAQRRHARPRSGSAEAEDAPLVVDEGGHAVAGVRVGRDGVVVEEEEEEEEKKKGEGAKETPNGEDDGESGRIERVAGIGAGKKRKVGRIVGGDPDNTDTKVDVAGRGGGKSRKGVASGDKAPQKSKKKAKKIKLSFGDDEG